MADPRADAAVAGAAGKKVHLGPVSAPVLPLALVLTGAYLAWFAVHYWGRGGWPTTPVKSVLQGNGLPLRGAPATVTNAQLDADIQAAVSGANAASAGSGPGTSQAAPGGSSGGGGGNYSASQIAQLWTSLGGSPATANFAAQVAMAESSGNASATSPNPDGGTNAGLFQLDTKGAGSGYSVSQLQNAQTNTRITIMTTGNGHNWSQWSDPVVNALPGHQYSGGGTALV